MIKINKHIEIVRSTDNDLSSMNQESSDAIYAVLRKRYTRVGVTLVDDLSDLEALVDNKPDLVFLGMKFILANPRTNSLNPTKIWITDYLDEHDIAFTGSNQLAHELESDKPLAKQRVQDAGFMTSPFRVIKQSAQTFKDDLALVFPLFVKPTDRGGGVGIDNFSVVNNYAELHSKVESIASDLQSDSLVEEYLPGREFSVAILKNRHSKELSVMPVELVAKANKLGLRILSQKVKASNQERVVKVTDRSIEARISKLATNVFHALGARDYGRIDIRIDKSGTPQFIEANLIPSLIDGYGNFPKACQMNESLDYKNMILQIADLALHRNTSFKSKISELGIDVENIIPVPGEVLKSA